MESSAVSQRLKELLNEVNFDLQGTVDHARFTKSLVLVLKGRKEGKN